MNKVYLLCNFFLSNPLKCISIEVSFLFPVCCLAGGPAGVTRGVPECFADHVLISDAVVGQGLVPDGVECVMKRLGSEFVGLEDKQRCSMFELSQRSSRLDAVRLLSQLKRSPAPTPQVSVSVK